MPETWSVPPRVLADAVDLRELVRLGQVNDGLAGKADTGHVHDARYVDFVSDQAIGGVKSFTTSGSPLVPAPTAPENPMRWGDRAPAGGTSSSTLNQATTYTVDAAGPSTRYWTLTASPTLAVPTGGTNGQIMRLWLGASGAVRTFTFAAGYEVSPAVPSRTISIATGTWELIEIEYRAGTWRLVGTDQTLNAPAAHASTHQAGGGDPILGTAATVQAGNTGGATSQTAATYSAVAGTGLAFVAPPSGKVLIEVSGLIAISTAGQGVYLAPVVLTGATVGSGTSVLAAQDYNAVSNNNVNYVGTSRQTLVSGLTPGASYNAQAYRKSSSTAATATSAWERIVVSPQLA